MELLLICIVLLVIVIYAYSNKGVNDYQKTSYYKVTHNPYWKVESDKGCEGEYLIYQTLAEYEQDNARLLFNCYIPKAEGKTTEIDVIMIHRSGLYIIESKNYAGWIFGNERNEMWTQSLLGKGYQAHKEHFFNPILQNKLHIKALRTLLKDYNQNIYSFIIFSDMCELKSITITSPNVKVLNRYQMKSGISEYINQNILSEEEQQKIYDLLYPYTQVTQEQKKDHIVNVKIDEEVREAKRGVICPRCGGTLILRTAKKDGHEFYGCSNYPRCRYTENIKM